MLQAAGTNGQTQSIKLHENCMGTQVMRSTLKDELQNVKSIKSSRLLNSLQRNISLSKQQ